jgi:hypothetical protein
MEPLCTLTALPRRSDSRHMATEDPILLVVASMGEADTHPSGCTTSLRPQKRPRRPTTRSSPRPPLLVGAGPRDRGRLGRHARHRQHLAARRRDRHGNDPRRPDGRGTSQPVENVIDHRSTLVESGVKFNYRSWKSLTGGSSRCRSRYRSGRHRSDGRRVRGRRPHRRRLSKPPSGAPSDRSGGDSPHRSVLLHARARDRLVVG